jgi:hypothetical protein
LFIIANWLMNFTTVIIFITLNSYKLFTDLIQSEKTSEINNILWKFFLKHNVGKGTFNVPLIEDLSVCSSLCIK